MSTHHLTSRLNKNNALIKLGLAASLMFYLGLTVIQAQYHLFEYDIISFWSVGRIANVEGYSHVYDLPTIAKYQNKENSLDAVPTVFPAVFIPPFQVIALFPEPIGAWIWRFINLGIFISYCFFFAGKMQPNLKNKQILFTILLSLPVYINFAWGQVNTFAMIGIGEFLRLSSNKKKHLAGAALGLVLIKPQLLILIVPMLLFQKEWKALVGLAVSSAIILLTSFAMTGLDASLQLIDLWRKFSSGFRASEPEHMINWRMAGIQIGTFTNPQIAWLIAITGIILTGIFSISLWKKQTNSQSPASFHYVFLNLLAATLLISWHSHLHYMVILIPSLIAIAILDNSAEKFIYRWMFSGVIVYLAILLLGFLTRLISLPSGFGTVLLSLWGFISNLLLLGWSLKNSARS